MPQNLNEIEGWLLSPQQEQEQPTAAIPFSQRVRQARQGSGSAPAPIPKPEFSVIPGPDEEPAANYLIEALSIPEVLFLDRAVRGAIYAVSKDEGIEGVLSRFLKGSPLASLADIIAGTEFSENVTSEMLWKAWGDEDPGFLKAFVTDIALGPSTWVGLGSLTKLGKAMRGGQMFLEVSGLAEAAAQSSHALPAITRSGKKILFGTAEDIAKAGGKAGRKLSLTELTLTEQAEAGLRGVNFGVGEWALWAPRNFNIALYNGAESVWEGAKRSAIGKAVRQVASPLPQIGEGMGGGTAENVSKTIQAQRAIQEEAWQRNAVGALYGDLMERGMTPLLANVPEEMRHVMQPLQEWGLAGVNAALDPQVARDLFDSHLTKVFGGDNTNVVDALKDFLDNTILGSTPEQNVAIARTITDQIVKAAGLGGDIVEGTIAAGKLPKPLRTAFIEGFDVAKKGGFDVYDAVQQGLGRFIRSLEAQAKQGVDVADMLKAAKSSSVKAAVKEVENVRKTLTDTWERASKEIEKIGASMPTDIEEADRLVDALVAAGDDPVKARAALSGTRKWLAYARQWGVDPDAATAGADELFTSIVERTRSLSAVAPAARESIRRGEYGVRSLTERIGGALGEAQNVVEAITKNGTDYIDAATRKKLAETSAKVERALGTGAGALPEGDQLVRSSTRRGAKAVTWNDLVQAGVKAIDDVNAFMLNQEKSAGVAVMMAEHYFSHVSTPAGKKLFDAFGKAAIGESSPLAKEYFTRSRQMSGWTVGEMNAVLHEMGFKASGDNPGKMIAEMDEFLIEKIKKVDPDYIKKIRAVDPAAAAYWESNVSAVMKRRASAGALATARAGLMKGISDTFEEGGLAIKRWNVPEGADLHAIQREMAAMRNVNTEIVNVEDIFKPRRIGPRKLESETELMLRQGIDDAARQGLHEDLKAIEDAFTESFGVPPARGIREGGTYIAIDRSLLNEVLGAHAKMTSPKYVFRMMQAMETATNFWKTWTLSPFPSFHFRNLAGDTILASLGGMGPRELGSTLPEMMKLKMASAGIGGRGLTDITVDLGHLGKRSGAEFLQLAKEQGVVGHSFTATEAYAKAEIDAAKAQNLRWKDWIPFMSGNRNALIRAGNAVGQTVNDTTRMAFFADQIRKGAAPIEAARATKKFLIDYTSDLLTHVESAYLKPLIPFYTWLRRSVPLMMEHAIRNPAIPATFGKALRSWTQAGAPGDLPDTLVPDYVQDMYGVPYKTGDDGTVSYFLLGGWVPGSDIARLGQALVERDDRSISTALSYVNPLLKVPVELLADKSAFTGGEIERFEGQTYEMFGMPWSAKTAYFLKQIRMVNELDKLNVLGVERTGEQGQRSQADAVDRWLGFLVGGKPTEVNPKEERRRSEFVIEREIGKAKAELNRLARSPKTVGREEQMDELKKTIKDRYRELGRMNAAFSSFRKKVAQNQ